MKSSIALVFVLVGLFAVATADCGGKGGKHGGGKWMKKFECQGEPMDFKAMNSEGCMPKKKENDEEQRKKRDTEGHGHGHGKKKGFFMKMKVCVYKNEGVYNDGNIDKTKYLDTFKKLYKKEEVHDGLIKALSESKCFEESKITGLKEDDEYASWTPFMECTKEVMKKFCKNGDSKSESESE